MRVKREERGQEQQDTREIKEIRFNNNNLLHLIYVNQNCKQKVKKKKKNCLQWYMLICTLTTFGRNVNRSMHHKIDSCYLQEWMRWEKSK